LMGLQPAVVWRIAQTPLGAEKLYGFNNGPTYFTPEHMFVNPSAPGRNYVNDLNSMLSLANLFAQPPGGVTLPFNLAEVAPLILEELNLAQILPGDLMTAYQNGEFNNIPVNVITVNSTAPQDTIVYGFQSYVQVATSAEVPPVISYLAGGWLNSNSPIDPTKVAPFMMISNAVFSAIVPLSTARWLAYAQSNPDVSHASWVTLVACQMSAQMTNAVAAGLEAAGLDATDTGDHSSEWYDYLKNEYPSSNPPSVIANELRQHVFYDAVEGYFTYIPNDLAVLINYPFSTTLMNTVTSNLVSYFESNF